jgi:hypothetical protein
MDSRKGISGNGVNGVDGDGGKEFENGLEGEISGEIENERNDSRNDIIFERSEILRKVNRFERAIERVQEIEGDFEGD